MALLKLIAAEVGVHASYWNIGVVQEDFKSQKTDVTLHGYVSQETRQAGKQPLSVMVVHFIGADYVAGADRAHLYSVIKQKPEFVDSSDI
jgi:hypothetical protein